MKSTNEVWYEKLFPNPIHEGWEDVLNPEKEKLGIFEMHRNYLKGNDINNLIEMYAHRQPPREGQTQLFNTDPVAYGITAYLCSEHKEGIRKGKFRGAVKIYFEKRLNAGKDNFDDFSVNGFNKSEFCSAHLADETEKLRQSNKMFTETAGEDDQTIKDNIKAAAQWYLGWLKNNLIEVQKLDPIIQPDIGNSDRRENRKQRPTFESLLTDQGRAILPAIKAQYVGSIPRDFIYLVFALDKLLLSGLHKYINSTDVFYAMKACFGHVGSRQWITGHIKKGPDSVDPRILETHVSRVKNLLENCASFKS